MDQYYDEAFGPTEERECPRCLGVGCHRCLGYGTLIVPASDGDPNVEPFPLGDDEDRTDGSRPQVL
jgi:hypothetical protein